MDSARAKEVAKIPRRPSKTRSMNTRIAWLKKKGLSDDKAAQMLEFLTDPKLAASDIYVYLEAIKSMTKDPATMIKIVNSMLALHKQLHGETLKVDSRTINVNIEADATKQIDDYLETITGA